MTSETLTGRITRVVHQDEAAAYAVFEMEIGTAATAGAPSARTVVVGQVTGLAPGLDVRVTGAFREHRRFGRQFRATTVLVLPPERADGIAAYLASGRVKGIGRELAGRIVAHFGTRSREALDGGPHRLREVPGIGPARATAIHKAWNDERTRRETFVLLCDFGLTPGQAARAIRAYGDEAPARVKADPYDLARRVAGIGFKTADAIAEGMKIAKDSPLRIRAAVAYVLESAAEMGHVFLPEDRLVEEAVEVTGQDASLARTAIESLAADGSIAVERGEAGPVVYSAPLHRAETGAAARLGTLAAAPVRALSLPDGELGGVRLAPSQAAALKGLLASAVAVLTGGPGTGKTTVVGALLDLAARARVRVALAAPTGRAAMRMREATGREAKTLHRLLEYNPRTLDFARCELWPLDADWVIVDEASMLDVALFDRLLRAIAPGTRLTLVGDADQLPPVGPGDPFRDVIASGAVPVARLTEVFRQGAGSAIVHNAHRVLRGDFPVGAPRNEPARGLADFYVVLREEAEAVAAGVVELVADRIPARFGLDPVRQVQVIAPMRRGDAGTDALNRALRARLNASAGDRPGLAPGDRVIQLRNNYDRDVFNGDIGTVVAIGPEGAARVRFDEREVSFEGTETDDLSPAYAITVHKAQGSEFPAVVVALHTQHWVMLRRNLLYTAITRGRRLVVLVGNRRALKAAVDNARVEPRNTGLARRLRNP